MLRSLTSRPAVSLILASLLLAGHQASLNSAPCESSEECKQIYNSHYECDKNLCIREHYSYSSREVFGFGLIIIISCITNSGGVGAGTVIVPVYVAYLSFVSSDAVHLSRITIFAGALIGYFVNWKQRGAKNKDRLLINYNLGAIMIPLHLGGAEIGVIIGRFLPAMLVTLMLLYFLGLALYKTYKRAVEESKKENRELVKAQVPQIDSPERRNSVTNQIRHTEAHPEAPDPKTSRSLEKQADNSKSIEEQPQIQQQQENHDEVIYKESFETVKLEALVSQQYVNFAIIAAAFFTCLMSALIRGGQGRPSILGWPPCTNASWKIIYLSQFITGSLAYWGYKRNLSTLEKQSRETMTMRTDRAMRAKLFLASYLTGIASGVVGVGGGMILSIYMLSLGVDVTQAGALSLFAVLFSASSTSVQSLIAGGIHLRHAYIVMMMSLLGAFLGTFGLKRFIQKKKKPSIILWILVVVLSIATIVVPIQMVSAVISSPLSSLALGSFC